MEAKIIGILSTRNVLSQGYPFLEAIYSFLNWGDKLYIGDDSNDGTEEILNRLSKNKKIKLFKIKWEEKKGHRGGEVIGMSYNALLNKIKNLEDPKNWVFELQSNEIAHEATYKELRGLHKKYNFSRGFLLPYGELIGTQMVATSWRFRLASLYKNLIISGDGASFNSKDRNKVKAILRKLVADTYRGFINKRDPWLINFFYAIKEILPVNLKQPIFRYGRLLPEDMIKKMEGHLKMYKGVGVYYSNASVERKLIQDLKDHKIDANEYYKRYSNYLAENRLKCWEFSKPEDVKLSMHPKIMQGLMHKHKYVAREDLIKKIIQL
jgi:hypothetical protein